MGVTWASSSKSSGTSEKNSRSWKTCRYFHYYSFSLFFLQPSFVWSFKAANQSNCGEVINPWSHLFTETTAATSRDAHQQFFHSILCLQKSADNLSIVPSIVGRNLPILNWMAFLPGKSIFLFSYFYSSFHIDFLKFKSAYFFFQQTRKLHVYFYERHLDYYSLKVNEVEVKKSWEAPSTAGGDRWQLPFLYCHTFDFFQS